MAIFLLAISCSKENNLIINEEEIAELRHYVNEVENLSDVFQDLTDKGADIFGDVSQVACGSGPEDEVGPCLVRINAITENLGFEDITELHNWVVSNGKVLYDIKMANQEYKSTQEFMSDVACALIPDIEARSEKAMCYKNNITSLLANTYSAGNSHGTYMVNANKEIDTEKLYEKGSSFYKLWRFFVDDASCK